MANNEYLPREIYIPRTLQRLDSSLSASKTVFPPKGIRRIKHYAAIVKRRVPSVEVLGSLFSEVCFTARLDIVQEYGDVVVPIRP